jgi:hypothetical protein
VLGVEGEGGMCGGIMAYLSMRVALSSIMPSFSSTRSRSEAIFSPSVSLLHKGHEDTTQVKRDVSVWDCHTLCVRPYNGHVQ